MGTKGIVAQRRRARRAAAGGHRRHDPRLAHARARRRPHRGGAGRAADPAVARAAQLHAAGHRLPRLRPHHQHLLPGDGARTSRATCASRCRCGARAHPGVEELKVAVMGCVVNGPGESKHANIGISLPGTFEEPKAPVYVDGQPARDAQGRAHRAGVPRASSRTTWRTRATAGARAGDDLSPDIAETLATQSAARPAGAVRRRPAHEPHSLRLSHDPHHRRAARRGGCRGTDARRAAADDAALCARAGPRSTQRSGSWPASPVRCSAASAPTSGRCSRWATLLLVSGLALLDVFTFRASSGLLAWASRFAADSPAGAFMMGATSGLVAAPCGAPAFAAVLTFVGSHGQRGAGVRLPAGVLAGHDRDPGGGGTVGGRRGDIAEERRVARLGEAGRRRRCSWPWPSTTSSRRDSNS